MVLLPYMNWGNLKLFLRQCKLVEANNPQVPLGMFSGTLCPLNPNSEFVPPLVFSVMAEQQRWLPSKCLP